MRVSQTNRGNLFAGRKGRQGRHLREGLIIVDLGDSGISNSLWQWDWYLSVNEEEERENVPFRYNYSIIKKV